MLEVRDLHAYYGKSHILQGVTLDVRAGEIIATDVPARIRENAAVQAAYLGTAAHA